MLSKTTVQLLEEVAGHFGEERREMVRESPEACLISLLRVIKERLPEISATLYMAVEAGLYKSDIKEVKKRL